MKIRLLCIHTLALPCFCSEFVVTGYTEKMITIIYVNKRNRDEHALQLFVLINWIADSESVSVSIEATFFKI